MKRFAVLLLVFALSAGMLGTTGCIVDPGVDPYYPPAPPVPPVPPVPPNPDPTPTPTPDDSWPTAGIETYSAEQWGKVKVGMTREEVTALLPTHWIVSVVENMRSYVYVTDEEHPNGFPKVFAVRYALDPNDATSVVVETSEGAY